MQGLLHRPCLSHVRASVRACVYVCVCMQEGKSPSTTEFVKTCAVLCSGARRPRCLVSFELRSSLVKQVWDQQVTLTAPVLWDRAQ